MMLTIRDEKAAMRGFGRLSFVMKMGPGYCNRTAINASLYGDMDLYMMYGEPMISTGEKLFETYAVHVATMGRTFMVGSFSLDSSCIF